MNPMWKVYKSKVMKTLNPDMDEEPVEEVHQQQTRNMLTMETMQVHTGKREVSQTGENCGESANKSNTPRVSDAADDIIPIQTDEGPSAMTQLAKRMQGAGAKGWKSVSSLFTQDDEHQLLEAETQPVADHPLAVMPEEPPRPNKRNTGFWDNFSTKWHQAAAMKQAEAEEAGGDGRQEEEENESGARDEDVQHQEREVEEGDGGAGNSFSKYATLGGGSEDTSAFKWNFVTSKLADLKTKSMAKSN